MSIPAALAFQLHWPDAVRTGSAERKVTIMNSTSRKGEDAAARSGADLSTPEISNRRAETFLIGVLWLVITLLLQHGINALKGLVDPLPSVAIALGHGLKAVLAS